MVTLKYTLALPQSTPYALLQAGCIRVPRATPPQTPPMHNPHKHLLNQYTLSPCKTSHHDQKYSHPLQTHATGPDRKELPALQQETTPLTTTRPMCAQCESKERTWDESRETPSDNREIEIEREKEMSETQQRIEQSMSEIVVPMQEENCQCAPSTSIWGNLTPSELSRCVTEPSQKQPCQYAPTANLCCSPVPLDHRQYVSSPCQKPSRPLRRTVWPTVFLGTYSRREIIGIYSKLTPEITRRGIAGKDFTITTEIPHWQGYSQTKTLAETSTHIPITIRIQRRPPPPQLIEPTTGNSNYTFLQQKPIKQKHPYQAVHWNMSFYDPKLFYEFCIENKIHRLKTDQKKQKNKRKNTKIIDTRLALWIKLRGIRYYPRHAIKKATRTIRHWYRILQELTEPPHPPCTPQKLNLTSRLRTVLQHLTPSVTLQKLYLQVHQCYQC